MRLSSCCPLFRIRSPVVLLARNHPYRVMRGGPHPNRIVRKGFSEASEASEAMRPMCWWRRLSRPATRGKG